MEQANFQLLLILEIILSPNFSTVGVVKVFVVNYVTILLSIVLLRQC